MGGALYSRFGTVTGVLRAHGRLWLAMTVGLTIGYFALQMVSLIIRFGAFPNYAIAYNWPEAVWTIIVSTPSVSDMLPIIAEEWLFEFGYMNYDFGNGISEWALSVIPSNIIVVLTFSGLIAANLVLLRSQKSCGTASRLKVGGATGVGAGLVALTSATMSWVVCCATPTWVVGLSMLGMGASTALWLEPIGPWLTFAGFSLLLASIFVAAGAARNSQRLVAHSMHTFSPTQKGAQA
ncbi:hypothetical protein [Roseibium sp.]|uniref:hypothetical protein n=1 Tax=Roseibium sp. TaxID=1936156 RepID=UPI003A984BE7